MGLPFGVNLPIRFLLDDAMLRFVCESGVCFMNPEEVSTLVLLQAIRGRVEVPPIVDGRGMVAGFALGAEGIQMGTRFVASQEFPVHAACKQAIVAAQATGPQVQNKLSTPCIRALKTEFTQANSRLAAWGRKPSRASSACTLVA